MVRILRRLIRCTLFISAIISAFPGAVSANSGPVYWQGYPSAEIMAVEQNSPIIVEKEHLVFDFSGSDHSDHSISGEVTASYEMRNPTSAPLSVQMAFPFVGSIGSFATEEDIVITAGDSMLPYAVYIGDVVDSYGNPRYEEKESTFNFDSIISSITTAPAQAENFAGDERGKLYIINVKPTSEQRINFAADFTLNHEKTKVLTNGFNRYERDGEKTRIGAWCYEPRTLQILVLGEDMDVRISAYSDGELKEQTDLFDCQVSTREVELKTYLQEFIKQNTRVKNIDQHFETQLYNLYAEALDRLFTQNMGFASEDDLLAPEYYKRILTLLYTVEFPPDSKKEVSVSYRTSGTMDKTKTAPKPLYSFDYILNPAENWSGFNNLNIKIITPETAPYIVRSSMQLTKEAERTYTAELAGLPGDDLSFTLYEKEQVTLFDQAAGSLHNTFGYFTLLLFPAVFLFMIMIIIVVVLKRIKKY